MGHSVDECVSVCVYVCMCVCACDGVCVNVEWSVRGRCIYAHTCVCVCLCMHYVESACLNECLHVCMSFYVCVCVCVFERVHLGCLCDSLVHFICSMLNQLPLAELSLASVTSPWQCGQWILGGEGGNLAMVTVAASWFSVTIMLLYLVSYCFSLLHI